MDGLRQQDLSQKDMPKLKKMLDETCYQFTRAYSYSTSTYESLVAVYSGNNDFRTRDFEKNHVHLGLIAVDNARRGQGLGRQMLEKVLTCAFDVLEADYVTLGVFDCNPQAYACYRKVGFVEDHVEAHAAEYCGESWSRIHMVKKRAD